MIAEPNETQQVLLAARDIIASKAKWCQGTLELDGRYCALGAMRQSLFGGRGDEATIYSAVERTDAGYVLAQAAYDQVSAFEDETGPFVEDILTVNDAFGHQAVMQMFNRAIELAATPDPSAQRRAERHAQVTA